VRKFPGALLFLAVVTSVCWGKEPYRVGFAQDTMANEWRVKQVEEFRAALAPYGHIRVIASDGKGETALQFSNIEDMISRKVDVLVASPMNASAMTPVISKAYAAGIPVVLLSRKIEGESYTTYIHPKNSQIGAEAARFIAERLKGKGRVLMFKGLPPALSGNSRGQGVLEVMREYPGVSVTERRADYLEGEAIKVMEEVLKQGIRFDAIFAQSDSMALGAIKTLQNYGIDPRPLVIVGVDFVAEAKRMMQEGLLDATFVNPTGGREGAEAVLKILSGETPPREITIVSPMVTPEKAGQYEPIY